MAQVNTSDAGKIAIAIGFLASAVKCGEQWGEEHERIKNDGLEALARICAQTRTVLPSAETK